QRTALYTVAGTAVTATAATAATGRTRLRPTPRREVAGAAEAAAAGRAVAEGRAGRHPVRQFSTLPPRSWHSRRSATASRIYRTSLTFGTSSYATRGRPARRGQGTSRAFGVTW